MGKKTIYTLLLILLLCPHAIQLLILHSRQTYLPEILVTSEKDVSVNQTGLIIDTDRENRNEM